MRTRPEAIQRILDWKPRTQKRFDHPKPIAKNLGVGGNTFRAFRGLKISPSRVFKKWVESEGFEILKSSRIGNRSDFESVHLELDRSIEDYWRRESGDLIVHYKKMKLIDLFLKELAFSSGHQAEHLRSGIFKFANIPLDRFSLLEVKRCFVGIVISKNPSMSDVDDRETYYFFQDMISSMMQSLKIQNLVFDDYAWNSHH